MAAQGGIGELQMAAVAIRRSRNQVVIDYVRLMRADHTKNNSQLMRSHSRNTAMRPIPVRQAKR